MKSRKSVLSAVFTACALVTTAVLVQRRHAHAHAHVR
jgi:hypothetical protein